MKKMIMSTIVLFSESIWIYFSLALFISIEWGEAIFVPAIWWIVAAISGYILNTLAAGRVHYIAILIGNAFLVTFFIIQNWKIAVPDSSWTTGIFLSIAILFIFSRSAHLVYKEPTRLHMLQRFELNMFIYLALMFTFTAKDWLPTYFHIVFLSAILTTLFGMIITLSTISDTGENEYVDVHKVGNSSGLIAAISMLFSGIVIVSALFFLPSVRDKLQQFTFFSVDKIMWAFQQLDTFVAWIFSFFNVTESEGSPPDAEPNVLPDIGEFEEETLLSLPIGWMIAGVAVLICIGLLLVFGHFLKSWHKPENMKTSKPKRRTKRLQWSFFSKKLKALLQRYKKKYRTKFARYYKREVYWYFTKVEQWGKKQGIDRTESETSSAYVAKLLHIVQNVDITDVEKEELARDLQKVSKDYEAAYYGNKEVRGNYKGLVDRLKSVHVKKDPAR